YGIGEINPTWLQGLLAWGVAQQLVKEPTPAAEEDWIMRERTWTAKEEAMRAPLRQSLEKQAAAAPPKKKSSTAKPTDHQGTQAFAPPPEVWMKKAGTPVVENLDDLAPWEKKRVKAERGRKRIEWKETRRSKSHNDEPPPEED